MVVIEIPPTLRDYSHQHGEIAVEATTVAEAIAMLKRTHHEVYVGVCDETGTVRQHIHLFVGTDFISPRDPRTLATELKPGDVLTIWTAVSGG